MPVSSNNGRVGLVIASGGRLQRALQFTIVSGKITQVDIVGDAKRLREMELALLGVEESK